MSNAIELFPAKSAILAEFAIDSDLAMVTYDKPLALLEVKGKPLIHHWLDRLYVAGVRDITIVTSNFPEAVRQYVRRGERWNLNSLEVVSTASFSSWDDVAKKVPLAGNEGVAFCSLNAFPEEPLHRLSNSEDFWVNSSRHPTGRVAFPVNSLNSLWLINMKALANSDLVLEPGAVADPASRFEGNVYVNTRTLVREQCSVANSVIGKDVDIGIGTELNQSLVMSNTALGAHLNLKRVIVDGPFVYDIDNKRQLFIDDPALFCRLRKEVKKATTIEKALAVILLAATFPVLLFCKKEVAELEVATGVDFDGRQIRQKMQLKSALSENRFVRRVPWLIEVIRGQLPLFGVRELVAQELLIEKPGVISLADFVEQDQFQMSLANVCQEQNALKQNLALAARWLPKVYLQER